MAKKTTLHINQQKKGLRNGKELEENSGERGGGVVRQRKGRGLR